MIKVVSFITLITYNEEKFVVAKTVYFDVLNDIVDEYNNTYHKTIKMKPIDVKSDSFAKYNEESNEKTLNLKQVIMSEFQRTKILLLKDMLLIEVKKFLL